MKSKSYRSRQRRKMIMEKENRDLRIVIGSLLKNYQLLHEQGSKLKDERDHAKNETEQLKQILYSWLKRSAN